MSDLSYSRINWEDSPSTNTPINANNLNKMDEAISNIVQKTNQQSTAISNLNGNLTASDNLKFQFAKSGNSYGYKDASNNFVPFKNGAVLVGEYSSNTTVNVSAYSPTSANQFVLVPSSEAQNFNALDYQNGRSIYKIQANFYFYLGTLTLNGDNLSVTLPKVKAVAYGINSGGTVAMTTTTEGYIPCKLYYIG